jgi:acetyl esterase
MDAARITTTDLRLDGPHGPVPVRRYGPAGDGSHPGLVWAHGGSFRWGDLDMPESDAVGRALAALGAVVVSVDYRLAVDGVRYPVPSDDVLAAFLDVAARAAELGIDPDRLSLGGGSAGGNLAAGAAKRLRDRGGVRPATVVLAYPSLHPRLPELPPELAAKVAAQPPGERRTPEALDEINRNYVGDPALLDDPYAMPALGDLHDLPPTLVVTSEHDALRASAQLYAAALIEAGNDVAVVLEHGTPHGHLNEPGHPGAERTIARIADWIALPPLISGSGPRRTR